MPALTTTRASFFRPEGVPWLAKLDLQSAYRVIPVHSDVRLLLGMRWIGRVCLDTALLFGLRSAGKIFSAGGGCLVVGYVPCGRVFSAPLFRPFSLLRRARIRRVCQQRESRIGNAQKYRTSGSGAQDRRPGLLHDIS